MVWQHGDVIQRREMLGLSPVAGPEPLPPWFDRHWLAVPVHVVEDSSEQLVTFIAPGAPFELPTGPWPTADGLHPWADRLAWEGHGCLMVQRPGEHHAVWHLWDGPERRFVCWYVNLQTAFQRTEAGYDTQDLEIDFVVAPDGSWAIKDGDVMEDRVAEGRFWPELHDWIWEIADQLQARLVAGERWWDPSWAEWSPPDDWVH